MPPLTASKAAASAQGASIVHAYVSTPHRLSAHATAPMLVAAFHRPVRSAGLSSPIDSPLCNPRVLGGNTGTKRSSFVLIWTACPRHSASALSISCPRQRRPRRVGRGERTQRSEWRGWWAFFVLVALDGTNEGRDLARHDLRQLVGAWLGSDRPAEMLGRGSRSQPYAVEKQQIF